MIIIKKNKKKRIYKNIFKFKLKFKTKLKIYTIIIVFFMCFILYLYIILFESEVVPVAIKISQKYATNIVSAEINSSVANVIDNMNLHSNNFLKMNKSDSTKYLDVDSMLINEVCLNISSELLNNINELRDTKIELPIGIFSGVSAFSGLGPPFSIYITSIGDAVVDYDTIFKSVGINQINLQIFLDIKIGVGIINPLYKKDINITRRIMLVNTVYNGEVPNTYLDMGKK